MSQQPKAIGFYSTGGSHGLGNNVDVSSAVKVGTALDIPSPPAVAFPINGMTVNKELRDKQMTGMEDALAGTLRAEGENRPSRPSNVITYDSKQHHNPQPSSTAQLTTKNCAFVRGDSPMAQQAMAVRRLTPRECERLQGFPDDHTLIPWRGKSPQDCPDGPRYKALGNSMAVPCMAWIGKRIAGQHMGQARYLSVCSGIEAASVAWEPLGWQPEAFAEVEKFPSAVLAHHWPQVPNLGDMTKWREWPKDLLESTDLMVGGTPCQAFSVAGLRRSLEDERGNLSLIYCHLLEAIDEARAAAGRPSAICVWENVPGVLSTKDNAFGCFLGALAGSGCALQPPGGRWANAGYVRGPKRQVCWRVLDAQYFGVAQRRRRVFVVANAGDRISPAEVLFEQPCLRWNPPARGEKGQGVAADVTHSLRSRGYAGSEDGTGRRTPMTVEVARSLRAQANSAHQADADNYVAEDAKAFTHSNYSNKPAWITGDRTDCLGSAGHHDSSTQGIGILDPRSQPITEADVVGTLSDGAHNGGGLTAKMPTPGAYSPCVANPLTARMGKGINTTLDEGQTPIVCQGEGRNDF